MTRSVGDLHRFGVLSAGRHAQVDGGEGYARAETKSTVTACAIAGGQHPQPNGQ
ncbi:MAG: hypothetical protein R3F36_14275 [Candidatus Competibacteraceae bacterium]